MPYAAVATRLNPVGNKRLFVLPPLSSRRDSKAPCTSTRTLSPIDKPLKSSLKSPSGPSDSESAPALGNAALPSSGRKSVRFEDTVTGSGLESVYVFRTTERPSAIHSDDTESDTDSASEFHSEDALRPVLFKIVDISPTPSPHTPPRSNVRLENVALRPGVAACSPHAQSRLCGTVRVRNLAFEKRVTAHFTSDDWTTVSEVCARYTDAYPSPPALTPALSDGADWDRFAFSISLEIYTPPPGLGLRVSPRTLSLAVRLVVPGVGEWWDNNGGSNFCVVLAPAAAGDLLPVALPP
ncbi:putative phosphatase regulatory subunit-domain-containing protein [Russula dissimulans]|nr:putative phosphatase regulatory subunit-domain-containing protein [Russula dissimulans]